MNPKISFATYMAECGVISQANIVDDGVLHRFHIHGDRPGTANGWYVLHGDGIPAGSFGSWRTGLTSSWCAKNTGNMTTIERKEHRERLKQIRQQRDAELRKRQQQSADRAAMLWSNAVGADPAHTYLARKGIQPHNLRQQGNLLLVPMIDADGMLWNLQRIHPDGSKRFLPGGRVKGCFTLLGELTDGPLYVCEGLATGATIHQKSGHPTACAMNAGNLLAVCTALAGPMRQLTVCADNDHQTDGNPGITKGREAAAAVGAALTWPEQCGPDCTCTDFNDVAGCTKAQEVMR